MSSVMFKIHKNVSNFCVNNYKIIKNDLFIPYFIIFFTLNGENTIHNMNIIYIIYKLQTVNHQRIFCTFFLTIVTTFFVVRKSFFF